MAKRFTDTEKWKRPWFASLPNIAKLAWIYVVDDCDHRGVWPANFKRISFDLSTKITRERFDAWFAGKVILIDADKYFIPSFVEFQYGERKDLNPDNKAHRAIITLLDRYSDQIQGALKGLSSPPQGDKEKDKEKDKVQEKETEKESGLDFESVWQAYPRKVNKTEARSRFLRLITSQQDLDLLRTAALNYSRYCQVQKTEEKYIKHLSSFLGVEEKQPWRDWLQAETLAAVETPEQRMARLRAQYEREMAEATQKRAQEVGHA